MPDERQQFIGLPDFPPSAQRDSATHGQKARKCSTRVERESAYCDDYSIFANSSCAGC